MDKKHEVVLMVRAKEIKLIKLYETLIDTTEKSKIAKRSLCRDLDGNGWIYENEKSIYGYELYFKKIEDDTYEIRVSNQKICVEDRDKEYDYSMKKWYWLGSVCNCNLITI